MIFLVGMTTQGRPSIQGFSAKDRLTRSGPGSHVLGAYPAHHCDMAAPLGADGIRRTISVVIPVRDEAPNLTSLVDQLRQALDGRVYEVLFVDDRSEDGSVDILAGLAADDSRIRIVRLRARAGKAAALSAGFREARGDVIATIDGDLQDDPADLPGMITRLDEGYDLVSGWKLPRRDPFRRRLASKVFNWFVRRASGLGLHDVNCGLKVYTSECVAGVVDDCVGDMHRYLPVLAHARGFRVGEVIVNHRPRSHGKSRYGMERYARGALDLVTTLLIARFANRPMHLLGGVGLKALFLSAAAFAWYGAEHLWSAQPANGAPAMIGLVLLFLGIQALLTGLVAEAIVHRHRWPIAYTTILTLPNTQQTRPPSSLVLLPSHAPEAERSEV